MKTLTESSDAARRLRQRLDECDDTVRADLDRLGLGINLWHDAFQSTDSLREITLSLGFFSQAHERFDRTLSVRQKPVRKDVAPTHPRSFRAARAGTAAAMSSCCGHLERP